MSIGQRGQGLSDPSFHFICCLCVVCAVLCCVPFRASMQTTASVILLALFASSCFGMTLLLAPLFCCRLRARVNSCSVGFCFPMRMTVSAGKISVTLLKDSIGSSSSFQGFWKDRYAKVKVGTETFTTSKSSSGSAITYSTTYNFVGNYDTTVCSLGNSCFHSFITESYV
jgi:hypothetical protein